MNYLDDVPSEKAFNLGGKSVLNLHGLLFEMRSMDDNAYSHYVSADHNYFADWILNVMKYKELADKLRKNYLRQDSIKVLEETLDFLNDPEKDEIIEDVVAEKQVEEPKIEKIAVVEPAEKTAEKHAEKHHAKKEQAEKKKEEKKEEKKTPASLQPEREEPMPTSKKEMKDYLWKHFAWDMAKEFMYGMSVGILLGLVMSKIFFRV